MFSVMISDESKPHLLTCAFYCYIVFYNHKRNQF